MAPGRHGVTGVVVTNHVVPVSDTDGEVVPILHLRTADWIVQEIYGEDINHVNEN